MGCCQIPETSLEEVAGRIESIKILSVLSVAFGVLGICFGIPTLILMGNPVFPFTSGIGIVSGVLTVLCGTFGLLFVKEIRSSEQMSKARCYSGAHQGFYYCTNSCTGMYIGFTISGLIKCSEGPMAEGCGGVNWSANYLLAAVNMSMCVIIWVLNMSTMIIAWKVHGVVRKIAKGQCMEMKSVGKV